MTSNDFSVFYENVHGKRPFPWQQRLVKQIADEDAWPRGLSLPTASGKTSVLDIAVFTLALQATRPPEARTARLRTFFIIDRRLVVDDVARHAENIREALIDPKTKILKEVRDALLRYKTESPLELGVLRGGMYRSDMWADEPNQPLICVTTVDQLGSRLLFRGYGVSDNRRPVHAALTGTDSLFIVDEAHLSRPFLETLGSIIHFQSEAWQSIPCGIPINVVEMSATNSDDSEFFRLESSDFENEILKKRLVARKTAFLVETSDLASEASRQALKLAGSPRAKVVGVVVNTVRTARKIFEELRRIHEAVLLTGRIRPYDRNYLLSKFLDRMKAGRDRQNDTPLFVVATQTIEVGADLDFDGLVTEAAPLDALRQRFGRLDRLGQLGQTQAVILKPKKSKSANWIYGEALEQTWEWLIQHANQNDGAASIDFGATQMASLFDQHGEMALYCERKHGPVLLPAHLDTWVQTNPVPEPDPDVSPFLHGEDALKAAEVQIVWRADLGEDRRTWIETLSNVPPMSTEALPLPVGVALKWLQQEKETDLVDLESAISPEPEINAERKRESRAFLIWRGPDNTDENNKRIRPGDTIVVRSREGGTDAFGWHPESNGPVKDVGDLCANQRAAQGMGRFRIRVHPDVLFASDLTNDPRRDQLRRLLNQGEEEDVPIEEIGDLVATAAEYQSSVDDKQLIQEALERFNPVDLNRYGVEIGLLWVSDSICAEKPNARRRNAVAGISPEPDDSDDDDQSSLTATKTLRDHTAGVERHVLQYAEGCGLNSKIVNDLALAARLHDLGKCDERFQRMLDPTWVAGDEFLAKGDGRRLASRYGYNLDHSRYPRNARHEFGSVALATVSKALHKANDPELVLHLIGTHHGYGRSLAPYWKDSGDGEIKAIVDDEHISAKQSYAFARIDSGWAKQFWALVARYGYWGLAYLETILRRADCVQSRKEEHGIAE